MNDREFLIWIYKRLVNVHGEQELVNYMHKFRAIIRDYPKDKVSQSFGAANSLKEMFVNLGELRDD